MRYANLGSVSHGTMREDDLIPVFCNVLEELAKVNQEKGISISTLSDGHFDLIEGIRDRMQDNDYFGTDEAAEDLNEFLFDALDCYAPPYCCFGSHPGDGSAYGFWVLDDAQEEAELDGVQIIGPETEVLLIDREGNPVRFTIGGQVIWEV